MNENFLDRGVHCTRMKRNVCNLLVSPTIYSEVLGVSKIKEMFTVNIYSFFCRTVLFEFCRFGVWGVFCVSVEEQIFVNPPNHHLSFSTTDLMSQLMWRWQNKIATIFCRQQGQIFLQLSTIFLWLWFFADSLEQYFFDCQPGLHPLSQSWLFSCALWSHAKSLQCIVLQRKVCPCC